VAMKLARTLVRDLKTRPLHSGMAAVSFFLEILAFASVSVLARRHSVGGLKTAREKTRIGHSHAIHHFFHRQEFRFQQMLGPLQSNLGKKSFRRGAHNFLKEMAQSPP